MDECIREIHAANDAASFWEQLYRGKGSAWKDTANPLLAETARHLTPGHALDLGCGEGGDTRWLATHEWHVTAVDIAPTAPQRTSRLAARNGLESSVRTEQHDLAETFRSGTFDLISAQYLQTPYAFPRASVLRRAAHALTPGGILLIVDHGSVPPLGPEHRCRHPLPQPGRHLRRTRPRHGAVDTPAPGHPAAGGHRAPVVRPRPSPTRSLPYAASPDLPHPTHTAQPRFRSYLHD
ncbi:class I SAM-dependent methyltransferase [Streptomyces sp. NPDC001520]|uniref:class I SAM-dependent methyltransferase n=1 Tax=Streptomyces sp. NPDC001520 TaxID=3364581 RepID=UPI0036BF2D82